MNPVRVWKNIYQIGKVYNDYDCSVYVVDAEPDLLLIDAGTCGSFDELISDLKELGLHPESVKVIIATHSHFDHIGSLKDFKESFGTKIIAHEQDTEAMETGKGTYAELLGLVYKPCGVDIRLTQSEEKFIFGPYELNILHIPGHTPGGIACYLDVENGEKKRILFGQDVNGPYDIPGADAIKAWDSLEKLINLKADILCEGHFGVFAPASEVKRFIEGYLQIVERIIQRGYS